MTQGALVGRPFKWMREDLYEQCSFHIAEKIPSSVKVGTRPISFRIRSYSSGLSPWASTSSGVICGSFVRMSVKVPREQRLVCPQMGKQGEPQRQRGPNSSVIRKIGAAGKGPRG